MSSNRSEREDESPPLASMLKISQLMYNFGFLRSVVDTHEKTFNEHLSDRKKKEVGTVEFDTPALVDTRNSAADPFPKAKLKNPITAAAILQFLRLNKKYIRQSEGEYLRFAKDGDNTENIFLTKKLEELGGNFDADIVEFDDQFADEKLFSTLVFSIVVNRTDKRITVVFRGSVTKKDFLVDLRLFKTTPDIVKEFTNRNPLMHKGFSDYLFSESFVEKESKIDQIIEILRQVYAYKDPTNGRDYSDYDLYITGHSLGGALSQLLAFILAGSKRADFIPKPVIAISFASPIAGNDNYLRAFQDLEKEDKLRHIRVSNSHDVVPVELPTYRQTGVNFHLREGKKMEVGYRNPKNIFSQICFGCQISFGSAAARHSLEGDGSYYSRLYVRGENGELLNKDDMDKSVKELYEDYAGDCTA